MLPSQIMRLLWDSFTLAIDWAEQTNHYNDIQDAARNYSALVEAANSLPKNQCDFWIGRADNYLPLFWTIWLHWAEEWEDKWKDEWREEWREKWREKWKDAFLH